MAVVKDIITLTKAKNGGQGPKRQIRAQLAQRGDPGDQGIPEPGEMARLLIHIGVTLWSPDGKDRFTTTHPNEKHTYK